MHKCQINFIKLSSTFPCQNNVLTAGDEMNGGCDSGIPIDLLSLEDWAVQDWAKSGITPEVAQQLGFRCVREDEICDILGFRPRTENGICEGYIIPFLDPVTGQPMLCQNGRPYIRIRMRYAAIMGIDKAKYLSPKQAGQHAFIQAAYF